MRAKGQGLMDLARWPAEPKTPESIDPARFARALRQLCGWMPPSRPRRYTDWILAESKRFTVDPFLLAGLIYRQSLCVPNRTAPYGAGLAGLHEGMHRDFIKRRRYRYWVLVDGRWQRREKALPRYLFFSANLRRSQPSIYFAAALLSIYAEQHPAACRAFGSVPHRHHVSHFIWGDRVRDAGAEDRVLRARRRLLAYYSATPQAAVGRWGKLALRLPLDAPPRKITSGLGDERAEGARRHKGVDFSSTFGEPVRAVADGKVYFAGIDARVGPSLRMKSEAAQKLPAARLGAGGLYVMVRHEGGLVSVYMHLASYVVQSSAQVKQGQLLGYVGRTGMKISSAHLHFELRVQGKHIDPIPYLGSDVFGPDSSYLGRRLRWERYRLLRRKRLRRWQARQGMKAGNKAKGGGKR